MSAETQATLLLKRQLQGMLLQPKVRPFSLPFLCDANSKMAMISFLELQKKPLEGFSAGLVDDDNLFKWELMIIGPPETF